MITHFHSLYNFVTRIEQSTMEWKKQNQSLASKKGSVSHLKLHLSQGPNPNRKQKQYKHKKMLTQGVNRQPKSFKQPPTAPKKQQFSRSQTDQCMGMFQSASSFGSQSFHTASSSMLYRQFDKIGQLFKEENERIRLALSCLSNHKKICVPEEVLEVKQSLSDKIKKQSILLKSGFCLKPLR